MASGGQDLEQQPSFLLATMREAEPFQKKQPG